MEQEKRDRRLAANWRARAKQTREMAITITDDATLERLEQRAAEYDNFASVLESGGSPTHLVRKTG
jgi:hypothetical protein